MDEHDKRYTATIYVAAPGTPLEISRGTSLAGHVYYSIGNGQSVRSYGFAPATEGESSGPGKVKTKDAEDYKDPYYARTIEITKTQYEKLREFGADPAKHGFDMEYHGARNSCIDFTWGALNHAGLHRQTLLGIGDKDFEGRLKPLDNVRDIKSIEAPFPKGELNEEKQNKLPSRTPLQWLITEHSPPSTPDKGHRDPLVVQAEAAVRRLEAGLGREYDGDSARIAASAAHLARSSDLSRIDHIVLNEGNGTMRKAENLFVVQGALGDPANRWAHMKTQDALAVPVEQSMAQLQALGQAQPLQAGPPMDVLEREPSRQPRMV